MLLLGELNLGLKKPTHCNKSHLFKHTHKLLIKNENLTLVAYSSNSRNQIKWQAIENMWKLVGVQCTLHGLMLPS
jgi:hypothetical protein